MEELVDYKTIKEISNAYINKRGKLIEKEHRKQAFISELSKAFGASYYYLPILLASLIGIQLIGFASTIDAILNQPHDQQQPILTSAIFMGIIPVVAILIVWYVLKPKKKTRKKSTVKIEGMQYLIFDN